MITLQDKEHTDQYEAELNTQLKKLQECQKDNNQNSCMTCKEHISCHTRKDYVKAVYGSMSKGKGGGFEF